MSLCQCCVQCVCVCVEPVAAVVERVEPDRAELGLSHNQNQLSIAFPFAILSPSLTVSLAPSLSFSLSPSPTPSLPLCPPLLLSFICSNGKLLALVQDQCVEIR